MKTYRAEATIDAEPHRVWDVLTDLSQYPDWDSGITRVEGTIGQGADIKIWTEVTPERPFPLKVTGLDVPRKMVWEGGMPLGLFKGVRTFVLEPAGDGSGTHVEVREEFTGLLLGLIWRTMPDMQPSFEQFVAGLKAKVEADSPPR